MSDNSGSGSNAILGVIIGAILVLAVGFFVFNGGLHKDSKTIDINVKPDVSIPAPKQ